MSPTKTSIGVGEPLAVGVEQTIVDNGHVKIQDFGDFNQRHRDMTGANDDQLRRRRHHLEKDFQLAAGLRNVQRNQL